MIQYIDKDALVAEIERMLDKYSKLHSFNYGAVKDLESLLNFLDTLDVKEVDLEKELDRYTTNNFWALDGNNESPYLVEKDDMLKIAKYFFELGLKAQQGE